VVKVAQGTYIGSVVIGAKSVAITGGYVGAMSYADGPGDFDEGHRNPDPSTNNTVLSGDGAAVVLQTSGGTSSLTSVTARNSGAVFCGGLALRRVITESRP